MNKCKYCNGKEIKNLINVTPSILGDIKADLTVWISDIGLIALTVDAVGYKNMWTDPPCGDIYELGTKKINYCPMCGRKFDVNEKK